MHRSRKFVVAVLLGWAACLTLLNAQSEIPVGTLSFGVNNSSSQLFGVVVRAQLTATRDSQLAPATEARATIRGLVGNKGAVRVVEFTIDTNFQSPVNITAIDLVRVQTRADQISGMPAGSDSIAVPAGPYTLSSSVWAQTFDVAALISRPEDFVLRISTRGDRIPELQGSLIKTEPQIVAGSRMTESTTSATGFAIATTTKSAGIISRAQVEFIVDYNIPRRDAVRIASIDILNTAGTALLGSGTLNASIADARTGRVRVRSEIDLVRTPTNGDLITARRAALEALQRNPGAYKMAMTLALADQSTAVASGDLRSTDRVLLPAELCPDGGCRAGSPRADAAFIADVVQGADLNAQYALVSFAVLHQNYPRYSSFYTLKVSRATPPPLDEIDSGINRPQSSGTPGVIAASNILPNANSDITALRNLIRDVNTSVFNMRLTNSATDAVTGKLRADQSSGDLGSASIDAIALATTQKVPTPATSNKDQVFLSPGGLYAIGGVAAIPDQVNSDPSRQIPGLSILMQGQEQKVLSVTTVDGVDQDGKPKPQTLIIAQLPFGTRPSDFNTLSVKVGVGTASTLTNLRIRDTGPGIFEVDYPIANSNGTEALVSLGEVRNAADELIDLTSSRAVKAGDVIRIYATGLGQTEPTQLVSGKVPSSTGTYNTRAKPEVVIDGQTVAATSSVAQQGAIGRYVVTVTAPANLSDNCTAISATQPYCFVDLQLKSGGYASKVVKLVVAPKAN
jgi:uncharacterized protein (TIGR03437 family)